MIDDRLIELLRGYSQPSPMLQTPPPTRLAGDVVPLPIMGGAGPAPNAMIKAEQAVRQNPNTNVVPMSPDRYRIWLENLKGRYGVR